MGSSRIHTQRGTACLVPIGAGTRYRVPQIYWLCMQSAWETSTDLPARAASCSSSATSPCPGSASLRIHNRVMHALAKPEPPHEPSSAALSGLSLRSKMDKELSVAVERCFHLFQELGPACPMYDTCYGPTSQEHFRRLQRAAFSSGFTSAGGLLEVRRRAVVYFVFSAL